MKEHLLGGEINAETHATPVAQKGDETRGQRKKDEDRREVRGGRREGERYMISGARWAG